ncbi:MULTISPECIES: hypothetical protein [unclassified Brucella]|uniref:hypothetical protein n=1 Tax=Brucella amazoniensis TaxID=2837955 RepID=UPI00384D2A37
MAWRLAFADIAGYFLLSCDSTPYQRNIKSIRAMCAGDKQSLEMPKFSPGGRIASPPDRRKVIHILRC